MRAFQHALVAAFVILGAAAPSAQDAPAPDITGTTVQGDRFDLSSFEGETNVVVVFYRMHT